MPPRSPLIFWLLLAATISIDAVAVWFVSEAYRHALYANVVFHALILGQLSVICIGAALRSGGNPWIQLAPAVAALAAALLTAAILDDPLMDHLAYFAFHAAVLLLLLWLMQRSPYWQRHTGIARDWRFSIAQLLILTTLVAALGALMRNSPVFGDDLWVNLVFAASSLALTVASVAIWIRPWSWFSRLAAVLFCGVLLGFAFLLVDVAFNLHDFELVSSAILGAHYEIQAIVLSAWLALGPILPVPQPSAARE
jgi:hypothetical protein